jgi:hypothetical protein
MTYPDDTALAPRTLSLAVFDPLECPRDEAHRRKSSGRPAAPRATPSWPFPRLSTSPMNSISTRRVGATDPEGMDCRSMIGWERGRRTSRSDQALGLAHIRVPSKAADEPQHTRRQGKVLVRQGFQPSNSCPFSLENARLLSIGFRNPQQSVRRCRHALLTHVPSPVAPRWYPSHSRGSPHGGSSTVEPRHLKVDYCLSLAISLLVGAYAGRWSKATTCSLAANSPNSHHQLVRIGKPCRVHDIIKWDPQ